MGWAGDLDFGYGGAAEGHPCHPPGGHKRGGRDRYIWTFLSKAGDPAQIQVGSVIVAGDPEEPFLARVVDVTDWDEEDKIVHLDVVGVTAELIDVTAVEVLHDRVVRLTFETGEIRDIDLGLLLQGPAFEALRDSEVFEQVVANPDAGTITWPNGADIAAHTLYQMSAPAQLST